MNILNYFNHKYFHFSRKTLEFGAAAGIFGFFLSFLHVIFKPQNLYFICAAIGVFILSLIIVPMLHEPLERKIRYGFWVSLLGGVGLSLGGYLYQNFALVTLILIALTWLVGISAIVNQFFFNAVLFITDIFIIGAGFPTTSLNVAIGNGVSFYLGGILLISAIFMFGYKERKKLFSQKYFLIPKIHKLTNTSISFGLQLSVVVVIAYTIAYYFNIHEGFWLPMTALLVMRPDPSFVKERIKHRFWGTFLGSLVGLPLTLIHDKMLLSLFMIPTLFLIVVSAAKHYGSYVFFLTAMISVLMNLITDDGIRTLQYRVIDTSLGIICAGVVIYAYSTIKNKYL